MPELPIVTQKQNIVAKTPAPLQTSADVDIRNDASAPFKDIQGVTDTIGKVAQVWSNANDVMQATDARSKHGLAIADIQARAERDPNFNNTQKYHDELTKAKNESLANIGNQQVAQKLGAEFNYDSGIASIKIADNMKQKNIVWGQVNAKNEIDRLMQQKLAAPMNSQQSIVIQDKIDATIHDNVTTGVLSPQQAQKMMTDAQKTSVQYEIYNDPSTSEQDSNVLKELKDPKGKYSFLSPDTRLDLITESQRRVFQNNQTYKRNVEDSQNVRNNTFIEKLAAGTANFQDIDTEMKIPEEQGGMKRTQLLQYKQFLERGVDKNLNEMIREKDANKDPTQRAKMAKEYNDLIETYMDDRTDQWKAKDLLAKALADGHIDADEAKIMNPMRDGLKDIQFNKDTSPISSAIKQVKGWMGNNNSSSEDIAVRLKQLIGGISGGNDPQLESSKIVDAEMVKHFPDIQTYPKEGKKYLDKRSGRAYVVYPDNKWAWVEGKNPETKK